MTTTTTTQHQQQRGKATKAELEDLKGIPVRLLEDIVGFGKKDTIMRVKSGRMRNYWFPRGRAEYMTKQRFRDMGLTESAIGVRDRTFGQPRSVLEAMEGQGSSRDTNVAAVEAYQQEAREARKRKDDLTMRPEQVHDLLTTLLPPVLTFERKPISMPSSSAASEAVAAATTRRSPLIASNAVLSEEEERAAANATAPQPPPGPVAIFGSVSTNDVLARVAEILAANAAGPGGAVEGEAGADAGAVGRAAALGDVYHVGIRGLEEGEDRIKRLGVFEVEIVVAKGLEPIVREVDVVQEPLPEL